MVLLQWCWSLSWLLHIEIYIPIWFYFNFTAFLILSISSLFTFQYGSTSIKCCFPDFVHLTIFTFQYGSTSMRFVVLSARCIRIYIPIWFYFNYDLLRIRNKVLTYLHSNMVLLQWTCSSCMEAQICIYIPIWFYFNLAMIRNLSRRCNLHSNMVLLQFCIPLCKSFN